MFTIPIGPGPVFAHEMTLEARRRSTYALRAGFALALLVALVVAALSQLGFLVVFTPAEATPNVFAATARTFFYAIAAIQLSVVLLAAPALAAGSFCAERAHGTLAHMMVTDLSDTEIVFGKLASRIVPALGLIACAVPVVSVAALLGGVDFEALVGLFTVSVALAFLGCALAFTVSLWARKTHEVLVTVYFLELLWLILPELVLPPTRAAGGAPNAARLAEWLEKSNPFVIVFAPYDWPGYVTWRDFAVFFAALMLISFALIAFCSVRLRSVVTGEAGRSARRARRDSWFTASSRHWAIGPQLDRNPLIWREWHRSQPSRLGRWLWILLHASSWLLAAVGIVELFILNGDLITNGLISALDLQVVFGFLLLAALAPTVLAEERQRGCLDVLLAAPVSTRAIVLAKWWGLFRVVLMLSILPAFAVTVIAAVVPEAPPFSGPRPAMNLPDRLTAWDRTAVVLVSVVQFLTSGALIASVGLALATWLRRSGRAVATSVVLYFVVGIGWNFLFDFGVISWFGSAGINLFERHSWVISALTSLGPIDGPVAPVTQMMHRSGSPFRLIWLGYSLACVAKIAFAAGIFWLTVKTFDRCMGRVPEKGERRGAKTPIATTISTGVPSSHRRKSAMATRAS
jgi:ABC-type transport system involved in multi-copper enzyme maturation permease subunit